MRILIVLFLVSISALTFGQDLDGKIRLKDKFGRGLSDLPVMSKNLIDKSQIVVGAFGSSTGAISATATTYRRTPFIRVKPNTKYYLSGINTAHVGSEYDSTLTRVRALSGTGSFTALSFTTSPTTQFVGINVNSFGLIGTDNTAQLEENITASGYQAFIQPRALSERVEGVGPKPIYISYSTSGYSGQPGWLVYCRYAPGSSYYVAYTVPRYVNASERADLYRITSADLYQLVGGQMVNLGINLLTNGENETAWRGVGKTDFTGGVHGDESLTEAYFFINGVRQSAADLSAVYKLRPANDFWYIQKSTMIETDNATPTTVALHHKRTDFSIGGYKTFNRLIWQATVNIDVWYHGIACVATPTADVAYDEDFAYYTLDRSHTDGSRIINKTGKRQLDYYSLVNGLGISINSQILKPAAEDANAKLELWDTVPYAKFYRGLYTKTPASGDVWESIQTVRHTRN